MKYIRLYNEEAKYLIDKPELQYPTVSYTEDTTTVHYVIKPKVNTIRMTFSITQDDVDNNNGENMMVWDEARQFDSITVDGVEQATPITTNELEVSYTDGDEFQLTDSSYINTFVRTMTLTFDEPFEQDDNIIFVCHERYLEDGEWYDVINGMSLADIMKDYDYTLDMTDDNRIEAITIQWGWDLDETHQASVSVHSFTDEEDPYDFTLTKDNFIPTVITYTTGGIMPLKLPTTEVRDYEVVATKFDDVTTMYNMFYGCSKLTLIDFSNFDTSNVTEMNQMFINCSGLTSIDLRDLDTSNVTSMWNMFKGCRSLTSITFGDTFDTSNVTNMRSMFEGCSGLTSITFGNNFNTSNVTDMESMFDNCRSLTSLDLSSFDTSNVTDMSHMFNGCSGLTSIDLSNFDTSNVTDMGYMFRNSRNLTSIKFGLLADVSKVTSYIGCIDMFTNITTRGTLYYPLAYANAWNNFLVTNQSSTKFPSTWTATAVDYENE